jgi:RNA polymerase sigma factor (sigma-70 family)
MDEADDMQLLRRFLEDHSEAAFASLVQHQIDLVYSAALRRTRNPQAAEDVTQAVFVVLARKAGGLLGLKTLTGWLYQAARLTASNYLRTEARRARREQEAYMQSVINQPEPGLEEAWAQCEPLLENVMSDLGARDRNAILLRYFQNKSLRDVGAVLGVNPEAARMRVNRALEKLRRMFGRRGVKISAVTIAGALSARGTQAAPAKLAASVTAGAAPGAVLGGPVAELVAGTLKLLLWTRYKMVCGLSASAIVAAGLAAAVFVLQSRAGSQVDTRLASSTGGVANIGPFAGTASEGFDHLGLTGAQQMVRVLGGSATVSNLTQGGALKIERYSSLDGVAVTARSAALMLGQLGISEWVFNPPLIKFGGYFANESRFDDATVDFYDMNEALIGTVTASVPKNLRGWTWNGWRSSVPIRRLVITGKDTGFLHGFIWFDDMQASPAREPFESHREGAQ